MAPSELDRLGLEVEAVAALDEVAEARPRQMVDERAQTLRSQHVHSLETGLDSERPVGPCDDDVMVRRIAAISRSQAI